MAGPGRTRVVITGVGVVSPIGIGKDAFWDGLISGRCGIDYLHSVPPAPLPSKLAAEIRDFNPLDYLQRKKSAKLMSRDIQLGVAAAALAVRDASFKPGFIDPERLGVEFGAGRMASTPEELVDATGEVLSARDPTGFARWGEDSMGKICPLWLLRQLPNMPACHVAIEHDARGPNNTITSRDASALLALAEAVRVIERDAADCMIVGACGSCLDPLAVARFNLFESLSRHEGDPRHACRPFDRHRDGTILGEGAGAVIVERYESAVRRGANIYVEILGVGAGCDGRGYANGSGGTGLVCAIQAAMGRSGISPSELGHINAHGKSTQRDDLVESRAYHTALGSAATRIPVTGLKSYFGHFDAGTGAVELAGSILALRYGQLPATLNYETPDPNCRLNVVHDEPFRLRGSSALKVNRTEMGQSAAVVIRAL